MHRAFHLERKHVATNLCPCDGCIQAENLKLKFVAHIGEVATQTIKQRRKLVGIDVIRRLGRTVEVVGRGLPYMLGLRRRLRTASGY